MSEFRHEYVRRFEQDPPSVDALVTLAKLYYEEPDNRAGGSLHIVLDDGNIEDANVRFCLNYARDQRDWDGATLASLLLRVDEATREEVVRLLHDD